MSEANSRPNFLFFLPDQWRADWLGKNQVLNLRTPHITRLIDRGVQFTNAYTPSPLCAPARACLAGQMAYPACGVLSNGNDFPLDSRTYYRALSETGYRVGGVGKFDLAKALHDWEVDGKRRLPEWGFTDGIDSEGKFDGSNTFKAHGKPKGPYLKFLSELGLAERYVAEHDPSFRGPLLNAYTTCLPDHAYGDNWITENGLALLRELPAGRPWHLVVNFAGPHDPMDVTSSMRERWNDADLPLPHRNTKHAAKDLLRNRQNYAAMLENIDRLIGRFLDLVEQRAETGRTIIVFSSDHGEMLGDHDRFGKSTWRDAACRIPLVFCGAGIERGRRHNALVSLQDVAATFTDYAGCEPFANADAVSLRDVLEGRVRTVRDYLYSGLFSDRTTWELIFDGRYKLVRTPGKNMLYDLDTDPFEDNDIYEEQREVAAELDALQTSKLPPAGTARVVTRDE